jgi:hypothetical protein
MATATMMAMGSQRLIPGTAAGIIGLLHMLQNHIHQPQDIAGRAHIPRDHWDRGHTHIL